MKDVDIIGLTGYAQHGKDTTAHILVEEYGFAQYAFAGALKSMAAVLDPIVGRSVDVEMWLHDVQGQRYVFPEAIVRYSSLVTLLGIDEAKKLPEIRRFLQVLGTEGVREHLGTEAWVQALELQVEKDGVERVVVSDVRFPNEAEWVLANGGQLWRVTRCTTEGGPFNNGIGTEHPSEAHIASLPATSELVAGDIDGLQQKVHNEMRDAG